MRTSVAFARNEAKNTFPSLLAAYVLPRHLATKEEGNEEAGRELLVRKIVPEAQRALLFWPDATFPFSSSEDYVLFFSPDTCYLAAALGGKRVEVWDLHTKQALPSLEITGGEAYTFVPPVSNEKSSLMLLIAGSEGLSIARFSEMDWRWDVVLKASAFPLKHVAFHAASGHVALLAHERNQLSIWDFATLVSPDLCHLSESDVPSAGPRYLLAQWTDRPLLRWEFTPDGEQVLMLHEEGCLSLHSTKGAGEVEPLAFPAHGFAPQYPLAFSANGLRLASKGRYGLMLWERATNRGLFQYPRHTGMDDGTESAYDALEFTHDGDPIILTIRGELIVYGWAQGIMRTKLFLGTASKIPLYNSL